MLLLKSTRSLSIERGPVMANNGKSQKILCSICLKNEREKGLMCLNCYEAHEDESKRKILDHEKVESQLDFAQRWTEENLEECIEKLKEEQKKTRSFFSEAHSEVKRECQKAGIRFRKQNEKEHAEFMGLVHNRYEELMKRAGQEELFKTVESIKNEIRVCKEALKWYKKLAKNGHKTKRAVKNVAAA